MARPRPYPTPAAKNTLEVAFMAHLRRFKGNSQHQPLPQPVWINQPSQPPAHAPADPGHECNIRKPVSHFH